MAAHHERTPFMAAAAGGNQAIFKALLHRFDDLYFDSVRTEDGQVCGT